MKNKNGFTLVELIAIIIIMGLIIGIIAPTAIKLVEKSKANSFREGLRSIIRSAEVYMEENDLKTLPEEGIYLQDNDLDIDYADGYNGIIKYVDGEIVVQNIGNGTYCGNGSKDTLTVTDYSEDCTAIKPATQCFIMGTTDTAGDTITGYDYDNGDCDLTNLVIPAAVNGVPVKYIADGAFIRQYDYILYYNEWYDEYDIKDNWDAIGTDYSYALPVYGNSSLLRKECYNPDTDDWYGVNSDYKITAGDGYEYCDAYYDSGSLWDYETESTTISSVDFSGATNLVSIGDAAFYGNIISSVNFGSLSSLVSIGTSVFSSNNINDTLDLSTLSNLIKIGSDSFYGNNIDFVELPSNLESIGYYSFGDNNLSDITIPASVTSIKDWAFDDNYWDSVTIESNFENKIYRFNDNWAGIGWPISLMPEEIGSDYDYTLATASANTFPYVKGSYMITVPLTGTYKVQLWGAAGGGADPGTGGYGGYISANFTLTAGVTYKLVIGQGGRYIDGVDASILASQGGGGAGYGYGGSGGGATILSINESSTIIGIAGGGGGAADECYPDDGTVGSGGYLYSPLGNLNGSNSTYRSGGTQTEGGIDLGNASYGNNGSYLQGGAAIGNFNTCLNSNFNDCNSGGGGGGGYYGGSGGGADTDAGSGGSSYVNTTYGALNAETVPITVPLKHSYGPDDNAESGYAIVTYIG